MQVPRPGPVLCSVATVHDIYPKWMYGGISTKTCGLVAEAGRRHVRRAARRGRGLGHGRCARAAAESALRPRARDRPDTSR